MNETIVIDTPEGISYARLAALKGAVKLESFGMKMSRGPSRTAMARKEFGLKAQAPHDEVIEAIQQRMDAIINGILEPARKKTMTLPGERDSAEE